MNLNAWIAVISEWMGVIAIAWLMSISPRFKLPVIGFLYARRDGLVALGMSVLLLISSFGYYSYNPPAQGIAMPGKALLFAIAPAPVTDMVQALIMAGVGLLPIGVAMLIRRQPVRSMGWHQVIMVPALLVGLALAIITIFLRNRFWVLLEGVSAPQFFILLTALGIALAEETVFRGYILPRLAWWLGEWPGMLTTSLLYTLWHLPAWLNQQALETILLLCVLTFGQGMVLSWIMRKSHHILAPAIYRAVEIWVRVLG